MKFRYFLLVLSLVLSACGGGSSSGRSTGISAAPFPEYSNDQAQLLNDNAARDSVVVTGSGLQYEVLLASEGAKPTAQSIVTVHYTGTLTDGTVFDSTYNRNSAVTFQLSNTIAGWGEGVQLMSVGSRYRFVIPAELAYGEAGSPPTIGPNEALIFVVELLEINSN